MARDSFILYTEQRETINKLTDEQAGKLIKSIYEYQATGIMPELEKEIDLVITPIKIALDKNEQKWNESKRKRSEAGKKGMANRWKKSEENITNDNNVINDITKITKITVNDNVNVNVNDNNNIKENIKRKKFIPPSLEDIEKYITDKQLQINAKHFYDYFTEGNWKDSKGNQVKNWKQKLLTWDKYAKQDKKMEVKNINNAISRNYNNLDNLYTN